MCERAHLNLSVSPSSLEDAYYGPVSAAAVARRVALGRARVFRRQLYGGTIVKLDKLATYQDQVLRGAGRRRVVANARRSPRQLLRGDASHPQLQVICAAALAVTRR